MTPEQLTGKVSNHLVGALVGQKTFWVHPEAQRDLLALKQAADHAGFNLNIASGFRDFERQLMIWNRKMSGQSALLDASSQPIDPDALGEQERVFAILRWSALPGASRHHWGSDFDVFDRNSLPTDTTLKLEPWEYLQGHQHAFYLWLKQHVEQFGFFFPYQEDNGGVAIEPWHISHRSTAQSCLAQMTLAILQQEIQSSSLIGQQVVLANLETIYNQYIRNITL